MQAVVITIDATRELTGERLAELAATSLRHAGELAGFGGGYWLEERSGSLLRAVLFIDRPAQQPSGDLAGTVERVTARWGGAQIREVSDFTLMADTGGLIVDTAGYCRSISWQVAPAQLAQEATRIKEQVLPSVRQNPGFQGGFWLADRAGGRWLGATLWGTLEELERSGAVGRRLRDEPVRRGELDVLSLDEYRIIARLPAR
jgi:hypothetical protein